jgi:PhoH-like ATPase
MNLRKTLIVDTSVLLYDKESIHSFSGNDVVIPLVVLDELDRFKEKPGLLGENARYVNRFLDFLRGMGRLDQGIMIEEEDQTVRVLITSPDVATGLDDERGDNQIIAAALSLKTDQNVVKVITKDINLRVKCDALGLEAEDYYKDHLTGEKIYEESNRSIDLTDAQINDLYRDGFIEAESEFDENEFIVAQGATQGKSALVFHRKGNLCSIPDTSNGSTDVKPRNKEQKFAWFVLNDDSIPLVSLTGRAGSGKTFLTLMAGLDALLSDRYERIVVTRNIEPVGRDIGFLPGDVKEKMDPWLSPLMDNFRHHFKDKTYFEAMIDKGQIEIAPLSFIRGRTFNNAFIIVDEAQNASIHELKTIITRIGEGSKIVLMGDTDQIDTPYLDKRSNGLSVTIDRFRSSELSAQVYLERGERSALATYASKVL